MMKVVLTIILIKKQENIKTTIKETKQQLIEEKEGTEAFKNKWFDKGCKFAIKKNKESKRKVLDKREKEEQEYHHKEKKLTK